jgi:hypothetical protein
LKSRTARNVSASFFVFENQNRLAEISGWPRSASNCNFGIENIGFFGGKRIPKFFQKALAFYFTFDSLCTPRRPEGRQDSMFADR